MRLAVLSDAHGNRDGLAAALDHIQRTGVDMLIFAGDLVGYYPDVNEVAELLRAHGAVSIAGNHDCYLRGSIPVSDERRSAYNLNYADAVLEADHRHWLSTLPTSREFDVGGARIHLCHGSPWSVEEYVYPDAGNAERFGAIQADFVVMGHTHVPMVRKIEGRTLVNPGSCGQPRDYDPRAAYGVIDTHTRDVAIVRVPYDTAPILARCDALGFAPTVKQILTRTR